MNEKSDAPVFGGLVCVLIILSAQNLVATHSMLPALPSIANQFSASPELIRLTLTVFFVSYAFALLVYGPLSDFHGRRPVLIASLIVYVVGSVGCAVSTNVVGLILSRIVQAIGAGGGTVGAWAIGYDKFHGAQLTKVNSYINSGRSIALALGPFLGGVLVDSFGWRSVFVSTATFGTLLLVYVVALMKETNRTRPSRIPLLDTMRTYYPFLRSRAFVGNILAGTASTGAWFAFLAQSPIIFIERMGLAPAKYGLLPPMVVTGTILGGLLCARLVDRMNTSTILRTGYWLIGSGGIMLGAAIMLGIVSIAAIVVPMFIVSTGSGIVFPTCMSEGLRPFRGAAASGVAAVAFTSMFIGAVSTTLLSILPGDPLVAFAIVVNAWTVFSIGVFVLVATGPA